MGYQSRGGGRGSGRGRGIQHGKKAKAKGKRQKRQNMGNFAAQENGLPAPEEIVNRTCATLHNLGSQRFALAPFGGHLDRWLVNLKDVLSEFESSPVITIDDQFAKERLRVISDVELDFARRRDKEASLSDIVKSLSENRAALEEIEENHAVTKKEFEERKEAEIKRHSANVADIKEELNKIVQMKAGIFRRVSKEVKAQKEAEATQKLHAAENDLASAEQHFAAEQEESEKKYEEKKQPITEQIQTLEKEIERQEIDDSVEVRRIVCESLVNAVNSLIQRKSSSNA
jgi:uncharacterized damage-inducible protein DinB